MRIYKVKIVLFTLITTLLSGCSISKVVSELDVSASDTISLLDVTIDPGVACLKVAIII